jgi:site-specific recombinase XerD
MEIMVSSWNSEPLVQFKLFVHSPAFAATSLRLGDRLDVKPISSDSATIYTLMFGKFVRWMQSQHKTLSTIDHRDLLAFLELGENGKLDLNSKISYRYLRLLERCYVHLKASPNPAQHAIFEATRKRVARDQDMVALTDAQLLQFLAALPVHPANPHGAQPSRGWKRRRDRAMQLIMLCAGLRVSEVIGMQVDEVGAQPELDGALHLSLTPEAKHDTSYDHVTRLHPVAVPDVLAWLQERSASGIPGQLLFPANLRAEKLDKATVYRQVKATFVRAGMTVARSGGRTLRNTFAVQELKNGATDQELTQHLGLALEISTKTYVTAGLKLK